MSEWILEQNPEAKIVLWAHNGHINESGRRYLSMGKILADELGDDYFSVGFTFYKGDYTAIRQGEGLQTNTADAALIGSIGSVFHTLDLPFFVLDLRGVEQDERASWLTELQDVRMMGSVAIDGQYAFSRTILSEDYDAIIFVDQMTPTNLLQ